jgi:GNAT superfamily N-acetyltransferase
MGLNGSLFTLLAVEYQDEKDPGTPIGMLRVIGDGAFVFQIYDLLVAPQYRGHGTGSALVQAAVARIKEFFPPNRWVTIQLQSQPGTESFYERMGFQILPYSSFGAYMQVIEKT